MFKSFTIGCKGCSKEHLVNGRLFSEYSEFNFRCNCGHLPSTYPLQKFFYYSSIIRGFWKFMPNNGFAPSTKCRVKYHDSYGLYVADLLFNFEGQQQIYQAIFMNDSDTAKLARKDAIVVFVKDELDFNDFQEQMISDKLQRKHANDFISVLKRWNREALDFFRSSAYDLTAASLFRFPRKLGEY